MVHGCCMPKPAKNAAAVISMPPRLSSISLLLQGSWPALALAPASRLLLAYLPTMPPTCCCLAKKGIQVWPLLLEVRAWSEGKALEAWKEPGRQLCGRECIVCSLEYSVALLVLPVTNPAGGAVSHAHVRSCLIYDRQLHNEVVWEQQQVER